MEQHTILGCQIRANRTSPGFQIAADIALSHHERGDRNGLSQGLPGGAIPLFARIAAVADVFDALTSERPDKRAWSSEDVRSYIMDNSGKHFDPDCVAALMRRWNGILIIFDTQRNTECAVA
jgi:response regulator RpfG family c-di-GMP phosphodiesterase